MAKVNVTSNHYLTKKKLFLQKVLVQLCEETVVVCSCWEAVRADVFCQLFSGLQAVLIRLFGSHNVSMSSVPGAAEVCGSNRCFGCNVAVALNSPLSPGIQTFLHLCFPFRFIPDLWRGKLTQRSIYYLLSLFIPRVIFYFLKAPLF